MTIETRVIEYAQDESTFEGYVAWDDDISGPRPGVVIAHAWGGAGEFEQQKARDLAALGYAGFCIDLFGKGVRGSSPEENAGLIQPFLEDREFLRSRIAYAADVARAQDVVDPARLAAIGFCFGGLCVLDLARSGADVAGVVSFHGLFQPPGNTEGQKIKAKVLALHGWDDPMAVPDSVVALAGELTAAEADWQIHGYGNTLHAFTNPAAQNPDLGTQYDAVADRRSWQSMTNFLAELF